MLSFTDAYTLWRRLPFPASGKSSDLIIIRSDLAVADEYVTVVIRFVERGIFKPAPVDVLAMLEEIMRRYDRLIEDMAAEEQDVARTQRAYAALLHLVYQEFLRKAPSDVGTKRTSTP